MKGQCDLVMARRLGERLMSRRMCKGFAGDKAVNIQCSEGVFTALKLQLLAEPTDGVTVINGVGYRRMDTRSQGADSVRYRVLWPETVSGPSGKLKSSSFTLSGKHSNETLFVLAEHLRQNDVDFVALANKHGNAFQSAGLSGTNLAYLSRYVGHPIRP